MSTCSKCGGRKKIYIDALRKFVNCPECGGIKSEVKENLGNEREDAIKALKIPNIYEYTQYGYSRDIESENKALRLYSKDSVSNVLDTMDRIYEAIIEKKVLNQSVVFYVGNNYDELRFVYGCQYAVIRAGMTTAPFISVATLVSLIKDRSGMNRRTTYDTFKATITDYIESDYIFINVGAMTTPEDEFAIVDLLSERGRRGLATYIYSYWTPTMDRFKYVWGEYAKNHPLLLEFVSKSKAGNNVGKNIDESLNDFNRSNGNNLDIDML